MSLTNEDVLNMIPRWESGQREGKARTARLREIEVILQNYKLEPENLKILKEEVVQQTWTLTTK